MSLYMYHRRPTLRLVPEAQTLKTTALGCGRNRNLKIPDRRQDDQSASKNQGSLLRRRLNTQLRKAAIGKGCAIANCRDDADRLTRSAIIC
jgi:hypothetical protein